MSAKLIALAVILLLVGGIACADPPPPMQPDPISLDPRSPSVLSFPSTASDIYGEAMGPVGMGWDVGGPGPLLHVTAASYGLAPADDCDAHSLGHNDPQFPPIVYFSASQKSRGAWNTQYRHQANRNQAAGDRFVTNGWMSLSPAQSYATGMPAWLTLWQPGLGPNLLSANQTRFNEIPSIPPPATNPILDPLQIDDMDALELHPMDVNGDSLHDPPIFFSFAPGSPSLPPLGSPAAIYLSPPSSGIFYQWAVPAMMGLKPTDDIDALVVYGMSQNTQQPTPGVDYALFSLAPGNSLGISGADVLVTSFQGYSGVYLRAKDIGLLGRDNVDGLDVEPAIQGDPPQVWDPLDPTVEPPLVRIPVAKANPDGTVVNTHGIVTLIGLDYIYIEEADRSSGIRIALGAPAPWYVSLGDDLQALGSIGVYDGERAVFPIVPVSEISAGNPVPAPFDLRTRAVGGDGYDAMNPGVTNSRGALNVGLLVKVMGMVTAVEPSACPHWFYIWDGANMDNVPVNDGTGNLGTRVEGGLLCTPWKDWVEVTGVVSTDTTIVPGSAIPLILPASAPTIVTAFDTINACRLAQGWNLAALPVAPAGSSDGIEHSPKPWDPPVVYAGGDPTQIDGRMQRWESCTGGLYLWDVWMDDHVSTGTWGPFGGAVLGDGYWVDSFFDVFVSYSGRRSNQDKWVSVCRPGWIILGFPRETGMLWEDVKVHDGSKILSLHDASLYGAGWLNSMGYWWDETVQGLADIGIPDDWPSTLDLRSCHGYWIEFYEGRKSLVFPADAAARFEQVNWNLDGVVTPDSEWGSLDLTFSGSDEVQYLNLSVNGSWQVQDLPLLSVGGTSGPKTMNIMFDLGVPSGVPVGNINYGYTITRQPQYAVPPSTRAAVVGDRDFELYNGLEPGTIAGNPEPATPMKGDKADKSAKHSKPFPNQECGKNECVPAAVSNSLQFLNSQHSLGMDAGAIDIGDMKSATGWTAGGCGYNWYNLKAAWMAEKNLPINTSAKLASAGINMDDVISDIQNGKDVELVATSPKGGGHCVAVTGCTKNADGTYSVTISHDTEQGKAGGTKTETVTYDPATGKFTGGSLNGWSLHHVVTESPK